MSDPVARRLGDVDRLPDVVLMTLPEATIVTVVEAYWQRKRRDPFMSDEVIVEDIEIQRSRFLDRWGLPSPLSLAGYVRYRLLCEHGPGSHLSDDFVAGAIAEANAVFDTLSPQRDQTARRAARSGSTEQPRAVLSRVWS